MNYIFYIIKALGRVNTKLKKEAKIKSLKRHGILYANAIFKGYKRWLPNQHENIALNYLRQSKKQEQQNRRWGL